MLGGNASHAAMDAGYKPRSRAQQGWRLMKTRRIAERIREIQVGLATGRDRDVLIGKLENIYRRAIENHQYHAATRAIEAQARLGAMAPVCGGTTASDGESSAAAGPSLVKM